MAGLETNTRDRVVYASVVALGAILLRTIRPNRQVFRGPLWTLKKALVIIARAFSNPKDCRLMPNAFLLAL